MIVSISDSENYHLYILNIAKHFQYNQSFSAYDFYSVLEDSVFFHLSKNFIHVISGNDLTATVNFQNNAQVQINAWFKLTPGTKHTVYNLLHCFLYFKRTPGSI